MRVCDITGEEMSAGFVVNDTTYIKQEKDLVAFLRKHFLKESDKDISDEKLIEKSYNEEYHYYTEWEEEEEESCCNESNMDFVDSDAPCDTFNEVWKCRTCGTHYEVEVEMVRDFNNKVKQ